MPDSPYRPNPYDVEDWANVIVPRGVTSLRAAKAALVIPAEIDGMQTTARPLPVQILDPHRKRIRCEASGCWREAHMTRTQGDDLFAFCPLSYRRRPRLCRPLCRRQTARDERLPPQWRMIRPHSLRGATACAQHSASVAIKIANEARIGPRCRPAVARHAS
jgi:hypothetical protein